MYILKNAYLNIIRSKGRNILIGIIIMAITIGACVAITINKSGNNLVNTYHKSNPLKVTFNLDAMSFRNASDEEKEAFNLLTTDMINNIGSLNTVNEYYYTLQSNLNSDAIEAVSYDELFTKPSERDNSDANVDPNWKMPNNFDNMKGLLGDFTIIAYNDISYNEDFINGDKKLIEGTMIDTANTANEIIISEELATDNNISVGDEITFTNTNDESITYTFSVVGIYQIVNDTNADSGRGRMMINSSNQIITNLTVLNTILADDEIDKNSYSASSSITTAFYIDYENLDKFTTSVRDLGLSEYYTIRTNEDEITSTLEPIKNIASFSFTFLIVILIVGGVVLTIINLFNIRERKYEIGVLRAIGMTKFKVTLQLISEVFIIALIALIVGTSVGSVLSQPISNYMLSNEIKNYTASQNNIRENFGGGNFARPEFNNQQNDENNLKPYNKDQVTINTENFISSLTVNTDFITVIELFGISLLLTILSGGVAVMFINKYEPNKILQNRG